MLLRIEQRWFYEISGQCLLKLFVILFNATFHVLVCTPFQAIILEYISYNVFDNIGDRNLIVFGLNQCTHET